MMSPFRMFPEAPQVADAHPFSSQPFLASNAMRAGNVEFTSRETQIPAGAFDSFAEGNFKRAL